MLSARRQWFWHILINSGRRVAGEVVAAAGAPSICIKTSVASQKRPRAQYELDKYSVAEVLRRASPDFQKKKRKKKKRRNDRNNELTLPTNSNSQRCYAGWHSRQKKKTVINADPARKESISISRSAA